MKNLFVGVYRPVPKIANWKTKSKVISDFPQKNRVSSAVLKFLPAAVLPALSAPEAIAGSCSAASDLGETLIADISGTAGRSVTTKCLLESASAWLSGSVASWAEIGSDSVANFPDFAKLRSRISWVPLVVAERQSVRWNQRQPGYLAVLPAGMRSEVTVLPTFKVLRKFDTGYHGNRVVAKRESARWNQHRPGYLAVLPAGLKLAVSGS